MSSERYRLNNSISLANLVENEGYLFDANVWLFLYGGIDYDRNDLTSLYSSFFAKLNENNLPIYTAPTILSEFHNRLLKTPYHIQNNELENSEISFKKFLNSDEGKEALVVASDNVSYLMEVADILDFVCDSDWMQSSVDNLCNIRGELNDSYIEKLCADNNLILVTEDFDFNHSVVPIVSSNRRYF